MHDNVSSCPTKFVPLPHENFPAPPQKNVTGYVPTYCNDSCKV